MPKTVRIPRPVIAVCPTTVSFSVLTEPDVRTASVVLGISAREIRRSLSAALQGHGGPLESTREVYDRWRACVGSLRVLYIVHSADHVIVTEIQARLTTRRGWVYTELLTG